MSSHSLIDSVIDDDDEFCPLCIEEFDLSDKNFKPCPCGYQICQFCYNNIKTHSEEGRCPNCRRGYDESTIQYKIPDAEEFKADLALKHRKAAAAKKKEAEKREIEASSRKNLAGVRVVQKNLVYVIGLNPTIRDENQLLQTLRGREYFGQYGEIEKIVVSKAKPGGNPNQGIGVYVTFSRKTDAATCINAVDGSGNGDRVLRAQYGTTKYCSSFLRNEQCNNRNCTFLHETGEDSDSYSRQDLSSMNTISTQRQNLPPTPSSVPAHVRSAQPISHPMRRQPSKDDSVSGRSGIPDGPALPSSASWANKDVAIHRTRRTSLTGSQASNSPRPSNVNIATPVEEPKRSEKPSPISQEPQQPTLPTDPQSPAAEPRPRGTNKPPKQPTPFDNLLKDITSPHFRFSFSTAELSEEEVKMIENYPSFIDPYGGVKRRAMREKVEQERLNREQELLQSVAAEEDSREAGSLQLGGEPEDANPPRGRQTRESHGAIQPPSQQGTADNSTVGSPVSASSHQFQGLNLAGRSLTPLQQQQLMLLKSAGNQQAGLADPLSSAALDQAAQVRQGLLQNQMAQFNALQAAQNRQSSRFSFNEAGSKNIPNARMLSQMQSASPNPLSAPSPQHSLASGFYASGVQGPPPGLKTAGTPPISGGGMFAQGHGFTSGLGSNVGKQDATPELMRELLRGRTGTNVGGLQGQEAAKREFMIPFLQQHNTPPPMTPTNGLLGSFYGSQPGMPESGGPQKQKKKGKKHRHANTSSGGGGVVDLADPSILQARMHQVGANATAGQALYGSQGQVNEDFPPLSEQSKDRRPVDSFGFLKSQLPNESTARAGTPTLPPGLPLPHAHPSTSAFQEQLSSSKPSSPAPILPPGLGAGISRLGTPNQDRDENRSQRLSPELTVGGPLTSSRVKDASQISFGSPVQKPASKARAQRKIDLAAAAAADAKDSAIKAPNESEPSSAATKGSPLGFSTPLAATTKSEQVPAPGSVSAIGSRPHTPQTIASRMSDSPAPRQPRILRVVESTKTETPPPVLDSPSVTTSVIGGSKSRSRRQSLSSNSRPDTPADHSWEADYYPSTSASRANSPPASSRIGSAPVRSMTKSQAKKERKQKAKEAEAKKVEAAPAPEEPVQAPIMGRKRKTKKEPKTTVDTTDSTAASGTETMSPAKAAISSPVKLEPTVEVPKKVKAKEKPIKEPTPPPPPSPPPPPVEEPPRQKEAPVEPWRTHNTVEQLVKDSEASGRSIKDLFVERTKPLHELLAEMHKSGELDLYKSSLFNPTNLSQRTDMKCVADDYDILQCPTELNEEHRKALLRGEPVRLGDERLKSRCLITPRGCVLRHLEPEEEERYLELEKNMAITSDPFMIGDDSSNPSGGLEALFANPEKFNICWVEDMPTRLGATSPASSLGVPDSVIPPNVLSAMEADSTRNHDWAVANSAELLNTTPAAVRSFAAITAQHMLNNPGMLGANPTLDDVAGLTNEELRDLSGRSQKDLELTRKELDSLDKKFAALLRRNRKLQLQALTFAAASEL